MKFYDIRKQDVVRFKRQLSAEQLHKLIRFVESKNGRHVRVWLEPQIKRIKLKNPAIFTVVSLHKTEQQNIPYAIVRDMTENIQFAVQERYLKVIVRQPRHPLTKVFVKNVCIKG